MKKYLKIMRLWVTITQKTKNRIFRKNPKNYEVNYEKVYSVNSYSFIDIVNAGS